MMLRIEYFYLSSKQMGLRVVRQVGQRGKEGAEDVHVPLLIGRVQKYLQNCEKRPTPKFCYIESNQNASWPYLNIGNVKREQTHLTSAPKFSKAKAFKLHKLNKPDHRGILAPTLSNATNPKKYTYAEFPKNVHYNFPRTICCNLFASWNICNMHAVQPSSILLLIARTTDGQQMVLVLLPRSQFCWQVFRKSETFFQKKIPHKTRLFGGCEAQWRFWVTCHFFGIFSSCMGPLFR